MKSFVRNLTLAAIVAASSALGSGKNEIYAQNAPSVESGLSDNYKNKEVPNEEAPQDQKTPEWYSALVALGVLGVGAYLIATKVKKPLPIFGLTGKEDVYKEK